MRNTLLVIIFAFSLVALAKSVIFESEMQYMQLQGWTDDGDRSEVLEFKKRMQP